MKKEQQYLLVRGALREIQPAPSHTADVPPNLNEIYTPVGHEAALDPERPLVVGGRGVGKSFWAATLLGKESRDFISDFYPRLGLKKCEVKLGFAGVDQFLGGPPSAETFGELIEKDKFAEETIWRAIILHSVAPIVGLSLPQRWRGADGIVAWASEDSERLQTTLRQADAALALKGQRLIVVFDALDRLGSNWKDIRKRSGALLKVALALRSYKAIKPKIFMRIDQAEDSSLFAFPDASKLLGAKVDLAWDRADLYGLLFSSIFKNKTAKAAFREIVLRAVGQVLPPGNKPLPIELLTNEATQAELFKEIAGQYMGSNRRRGKTYSWIHAHLADAFGRVSPRSFLEAMREAANEGEALVDRVIDPKGLQQGLQKASALRVEQLREEFGWIKSALEPLADLSVPCVEDEIFERWKKAGTISAIQKLASLGTFLEPVEFDSAGPVDLSLLDAMRRIGVAERRWDKRVNLPDIYRVAAKLLRRGGVRPASS